MQRLPCDEERFVLLAMHQMLVERGLCLRQPTTQGNLLVFLSYYRTERPDLVQYPAVHVNYRFTGFLDGLYATLVVRLHRSDAFAQDELWRYAADFKTNAGKQLGIKLTCSLPNHSTSVWNDWFHVGFHRPKLAPVRSTGQPASLPHLVGGLLNDTWKKEP